ncbi:MAG: YbaB/EbfC family nucleoid-associated protein [Chloroflexi bacterium]|nr:YbaB/EbfC family nucleoid-associated protein [Chloroflexota bacterium]
MLNKNIMKQAQELQARLAKAQEELGNETVEASSGGGMVTVVVDGHQNFRSIKIKPEAVDPEDISLVEDLVLAAVNEGLKRSQELVSKRMSALTGGLKLPGM